MIYISKRREKIGRSLLTGAGIQVGTVQATDERRSSLEGGGVELEVATDEELTCHDFYAICSRCAV